MSNNNQKSATTQNNSQTTPERVSVPEHVNFLYVNTNADSVKLLDLDRQYRSGCTCTSEQTNTHFRGWTNNKADDNIVCSTNTQVVPENKNVPSGGKQKHLVNGMTSTYHSRVQPYVSYPSYEWNCERKYQSKYKAYLFHHYKSVTQYIEQYRMFHTSVPYVERNPIQQPRITDPPWDPQIHRIHTPR